MQFMTLAFVALLNFSSLISAERAFCSYPPDNCQVNAKNSIWKAVSIHFLLPKVTVYVEDTTMCGRSVRPQYQKPYML
ncbi:DNA mismatch repair protein [Venturia inaequalis]|nr:DNA mismatch repair protein [Venturia inaequalis]